MPDPKCPYCEYIWNDIYSNVNLHKCLKQKDPEKRSDLFDLYDCDSDNHNECKVYLLTISSKDKKDGRGIEEI